MSLDGTKRYSHLFGNFLMRHITVVTQAKSLCTFRRKSADGFFNTFAYIAIFGLFIHIAGIARLIHENYSGFGNTDACLMVLNHRLMFQMIQAAVLCPFK